MKRAKQRPLPMLDKLVSSIKRTDRALSETLTFCAASNKRIAKKKKRATVNVLGQFVNGATTRMRKRYKLKDLLAQIPPGTKFEELDWGPPVGKEII